MARSDNQKLKLCYIMKILSECTSKGNGITMQELIDRLAMYNVSAERKSIYSDIRAINEFGEFIKIDSYRRDGEVRYYADERMLSLADIKILADVIAASKFVTEKRSRELIGKLERMVSDKEKRELNRTVYIRRHATETDDDGYSNVDPIQTAMRENRQIEFTYLQWDKSLQLVPRDAEPRSGISPWWLVYNHENYYLGAYDGKKQSMRTFRVDKMRNVKVLDEPREGREAAELSGPDQYAQARFEMFDGSAERVRVSCPKEMIGTFVDKIGRDITVISQGDTVELSFVIVPNRFFLTWLLALGDTVKLLSPQHCIDELETMCLSMVKNHERRPITTVVFDLAGVLLRVRSSEYMDELGFSEEEKEFGISKVLHNEEWDLLDAGVISQDEAIERWIRKYPEHTEAIRKLMDNDNLHGLVEPYPDAEDILRSLKEQGYEVYLLSNYPKELYELHEKQLPFLKFLDGCIISGIEKRVKPNEDIFELFLSRYGKKASECVFIDDRADNTRTAKAMGIHSFVASDRTSGFSELFAFLSEHRTQ
ncbi:MAG: HAD-IA family hydrolase [Lachnospiraceae bacterium]|nr:HAD-IA family hydrolase [Lachnospiraceae bacterium]